MKCKLCGEQFSNGMAGKKHYAEKHPDFVKPPRKSRIVSVSASPLDKIREHQRGIQSALRELDTERDGLHARIVEIDNLVAKYKTFENA